MRVFKKRVMDEFDQSILYASMEISQLNPFVQLIYVKRKKHKNIFTLNFETNSIYYG
jgi:hypothetical protein